ncbi:2474_t:CDS:2 [Ambispora gerdemannii]|uniref:2474_t:CDS:1 n=1 Tax=Ambispora gerdemannii TaxID=144530 RepID=A0A9N8YR66_9GLOM|nr:2474_t:CDS:2 [Ambispora gerdemannii]
MISHPNTGHTDRSFPLTVDEVSNLEIDIFQESFSIQHDPTSRQSELIHVDSNKPQYSGISSTILLRDKPDQFVWIAGINRKIQYNLSLREIKLVYVDELEQLLQNEKEQLETDLEFKDQTRKSLHNTHKSLKDEVPNINSLWERQNFVLEITSDEKLLNKYGYSAKTTGKKLNKLLIQGDLQQLIIRTVIEKPTSNSKSKEAKANGQRKTKGKDMQYLEANLILQCISF